MTEAFRLTLELGEETRARWQAAAERIDYGPLDVWAYDTLDAATDPDAGQVVGVERIGDPERVDLRARLTTAEQEREEYASECRVEAQRRRVAEARVDAAAAEHARQSGEMLGLELRVKALSEALPILLRDTYHLSCTPEEWATVERARAALACPPQQEATHG